MMCHIIPSIAWLTSVGFNDWERLEHGTPFTHWMGQWWAGTQLHTVQLGILGQPTQFNIYKQGTGRGRWWLG